jgi:hypothetical protein
MKEETEEAEGSTEKEEDHHHTPVAGGRWGKPPSGPAQGDTRGSRSSSPTPDIKADQMQTNKQSRMKSSTDPLTYGALCLNDLARPDDNFFHIPAIEEPAPLIEIASPTPVIDAPTPNPVNEEKNEQTRSVASDECDGGDSTTPVAGSRWGNPPSGLAQGFPRGSPPNSPTTSSSRTDQIQIRKLEHPRQLRGDGKSYLRCTPLATKLRLGSPIAAEEAALLDVCSNIGLIDRTLFYSAYPETAVYPSSRVISGVGTAKTSGFAVIPVWMDCWDSVDHCPVTAEFDVEVHLVENFSPGLLLGLDAIRDYQMDLLMSSMTGRIDHAGLSFPLYSHAAPKFQKVRIFTSQKVTIPGRSTMPVRIKSVMQEGIDYVFDPYMVVTPSLPSAPQLPHAVIAKGTMFLMFSNHSEHPIHLDKNHALGEAQAVLFGSVLHRTPHTISWDDLIAPRSTGKQSAHSIGIRSPQSIAVKELFGPLMDHSEFGASACTAHCDPLATEDELRFDAYGRELPRKRSVPDSTIGRIAASAPRRIPGETFPDNEEEDNDVKFPQVPTDPKNPADPAQLWNICDGLSPDQQSELLALLTEFGDVFSDGIRIRHVNIESISIDTGTHKLPEPAQLRPLGPAKRKIVEETLAQLFKWNAIEESNSPTASAVVLVWQNNKWRFCVDFRQLNHVTIRDAYPMLRSDYIFSSLAGKRFFSALDAVKGYHQLEIDEVDRHKTAFITHRGLFQFKRMPFGLRNAPAQFQRMMDSILGTLRWEAALCYIDDVLIYSDTWESHIVHLRQLLTSCRQAGLMFSQEKCRFGYAELQLLGLGLSRYGMFTLKDKVKAVSDLAPPKSLGELYRLLGMFGYYRGFIRNFARIARPLELLKRGTGVDYSSKRPISWNQDAQDAFDELKARLCNAPILAHPKFDGRRFTLYTDASAEAFGAVLCQHWTEEDYEPDPESSVDAPVPGNSFFAIQESPGWESAYESDSAFRSTYKKLRLQQQVPGDIPMASTLGFSLHADGSMRYRTLHGERVCLPQNMLEDCLRLSHDALGHFGTDKTYDRITETYYRPGLSTIVDTYVKHCRQCIVNKTSRSKSFGNLLSIDPPSGRIPKAFESINMDLIVGLPRSGGYDAILTVVDRSTKTAIFIPTTSDFTAESLANIFFEKVVSRGFLPVKFITDRDPRLILSFWKTITHRLGIDHRKTAAYHAQTDGAAERMNQTLEVALRFYVNERQNNWHRHLGLIELAYNSARHPGTGFSPFQLLYANPDEPVRRLLSTHIPTMENDDPAVGHENPSATEFLDGVRSRLQDAQEAVARGLAYQKEYYNKKHRNDIDVSAGDYVTIRLDKHPVSLIKRNKLTQQKLGPCRVIRVRADGRAVEVDLPKNVNIHPVISMQHVEKVPDPIADPWKRMNEDSADVVDVRVRNGHKEYRIRDTWMQDVSQDLITAFEDRTRLLEQIQTPYVIIDHREHRSGRRYRITFGDGRKDRWIKHTEADQNAVEDYDTRPQVHVIQSSRTVETPFESRRPRPGERLERPILYISRQTTGGEPRYGSTERELACFYWAIHKLHMYLEGNTFTVFTDHESIRDVLHSAPRVDFSKRIDKYRMLLQPYLDDMEIIYRPGKKMVMVDPLSRARYLNDPQEEVFGRPGSRAMKVSEVGDEGRLKSEKRMNDGKG